MNAFVRLFFLKRFDETNILKQSPIIQTNGDLEFTNKIDHSASFKLTVPLLLLFFKIYFYVTVIL